MPTCSAPRPRAFPNNHSSATGRSVSYGEFDARTDALAAGLADLGVKPGEVLSVMLPNRFELLGAWWAILKAGGGVRPDQPGVHHARGGISRGSLVRRAPGDLATLMYTSGTIGKPKAPC